MNLQNEPNKQAWEKLPAKIPGQDWTMGDMVKALRRYVSAGDFIMAHYYLDLFTKLHGVGAVEKLSKAAGFSRKSS